MTKPATTPLRDEDDFTHYFNATGRLSRENTALRAAMQEALGVLDLAYRGQASVLIRQAADTIRDALGVSRV